MKLAQRLGYASTDTMLGEMTADEFEEHKAVWEDDPRDGWRQDYGWAVLAAMLANMFREKGRPAVGPKQFMPVFGEERRKKTERSAQAEAARALAWVLSVGGSVVEGPKGA